MKAAVGFASPSLSALTVRFTRSRNSSPAGREVGSRRGKSNVLENDDDEFVHLDSDFDRMRSLFKYVMGELSHIKSILQLILDEQRTPKGGEEKTETKQPVLSLSDLFNGDKRTDPSIRKEALSLAIRLEYLYIKNGYGTYNHRTANSSAYDWICSHGQQDQDRLIAWCEKHSSNLIGFVRVDPDMFDYLWRSMIATGD